MNKKTHTYPAPPFETTRPIRVNNGLTTGYYGDYNAIVQTLNEMPNVEVTHATCNQDVILREISITLLTGKNTRTQLFIAQKDPVRKARGAKLAEQLNQRIEEALEKSTKATALSSMKSKIYAWFHRLKSHEMFAEEAFSDVHLHGYVQHHDGKSHHKYV